MTIPNKIGLNNDYNFSDLMNMKNANRSRSTARVSCAIQVPTIYPEKVKSARQKKTNAM